MKYEYKITEIEYEEKENLAGAWKAENFRALLKEIDFDDYDTVAESDLLEMLIMALDDMGVEDGGEAVFSFIMGEKMLDLLHHDFGQIIALIDFAIIWEGRIDRHTEQFFIAAVLIFKVENCNRPATDDTARHEWRAGYHQRIQRIAIRG